MNTFQGLFQYRKINVVAVPVVSVHCNSYTATGTYYLDRTRMIGVATKVYINDVMVIWKKTAEVWFENKENETLILTPILQSVEVCAYTGKDHKIFNWGCRGK